ncbi:MFS transporter [Siccirubricoccus sp. G192]|uniref:MFS transporter n=1 Tax=Siccirubricoccus sp. G192 TaxID=2849651 RepID=UPI0020C47420|nr:MFS transporter [Siccirubricoccus sp. G192]
MPASPASSPRLPVSIGLLLGCAMLTAALGMGLRQTSGLFLAPMTAAHGWTASGFAFAIALQVLLNGVSQPVLGQVADRIGARRVIMGGAALQACAVFGMAMSEGLPMFTFFAGVVMGLAVSAAGMPVVMASLTRLLPDSMRSRAIGLGTAGSSFGQFLVVPLVQLGINGFGWQAAMLGVALASLLIIPLALPLNDAPAPPAPGATEQTAREALSVALRDSTFWCLFFGFFVCGMHVSFLAVHLPGFVASCHLPAAVGAGAISLIGLFNIAGSLAAGGAGRALAAAGAAGGDLCRARRADGRLHAGGEDHRLGAHLFRADGAALALHRAAHHGALRPGIRHPLAGDDLRHDLPRPPDRRLHRRLARRAGLRPDRQLRPDVGHQHPRRRLRRAGASAGAGRAAGAGGGAGLGLRTDRR